MRDDDSLQFVDRAVFAGLTQVKDFVIFSLKISL